jgi:hypothetical protein
VRMMDRVDEEDGTNRPAARERVALPCRVLRLGVREDDGLSGPVPPAKQPEAEYAATVISHELVADGGPLYLCRLGDGDVPGPRVQGWAFVAGSMAAKSCPLRQGCRKCGPTRAWSAAPAAPAGSGIGTRPRAVGWRWTCRRPLGSCVTAITDEK